MDLSTKPYKALRYHQQPPRSVAFHRTYPLFASSSDDGTVQTQVLAGADIYFVSTDAIPAAGGTCPAVTLLQGALPSTVTTILLLTTVSADPRIITRGDAATTACQGLQAAVAAAASSSLGLQLRAAGGSTVGSASQAGGSGCSSVAATPARIDALAGPQGPAGPPRTCRAAHGFRVNGRSSPGRALSKPATKCMALSYGTVALFSGLTNPPAPPSGEGVPGFRSEGIDSVAVPPPFAPSTQPSDIKKEGLPIWVIAVSAIVSTCIFAGVGVSVLLIMKTKGINVFKPSVRPAPPAAAAGGVPAAGGSGAVHWAGAGPAGAGAAGAVAEGVVAGQGAVQGGTAPGAVPAAPQPVTVHDNAAFEPRGHPPRPKRSPTPSTAPGSSPFPSPSGDAAANRTTIWPIAAISSDDLNGDSKLPGAVRNLVGEPNTAALRQTECGADGTSRRAWVAPHLVGWGPEGERWAEVYFDQAEAVKVSGVANVTILLLEEGTLSPVFSSIALLVILPGSNATTHVPLAANLTQSDLGCPGFNSFRPRPEEGPRERGVDVATLRAALVVGVRLNVNEARLSGSRPATPAIGAVGLVLKRRR
ncbi:Ribosome biogenesis protein BOP1, partial [Tetrabaena socialis]